MSKVPGIKAKHAVITPRCRSRGDLAAFDDAAVRLRMEYEETIRLRDANDAPAANYHLILSVEPVREGAEP